MFCFLFNVSALAQTDSLKSNYFLPDNIYNFASHLYNEGDYIRAAGEFQRFLFTADSIKYDTGDIFYKIGLCYKFGGDFPNAIKSFYKAIIREPQSMYIKNAYYQIALSYSLAGNYKKSNELIKSYLNDAKQESLDTQAKQLTGLNYIYMKKWPNAFSCLSKLDKKDSVNIALASLALEGHKLFYKNKLMAGLLSSVIPGAGKIYCNRPIDGLFSLFLTGLTGWQAYEGFHRDGLNSFKGWAYGSICGVLYCGNIYGSVVAAQIYNEQKDEQFIKKVKISINAQFN
jgi:tetratricopeptide (TPR) repeat protein